jgi:uncharacterized protein YeaO (DUF488 family)
MPRSSSSSNELERESKPRPCLANEVMSIYTASYFEPEFHHGKLISISRSQPKGFRVAGNLPFLAPSVKLLEAWKQQKVDEAGYVQRYREQIAASWITVKGWLDALKPAEDSTLLCWERQGEFCHRNLVAHFVQKHRPDCYGGRDIVRVGMPECKKCSAEVILGLDSSYCPRCQEWTRS